MKQTALIPCQRLEERIVSVTCDGCQEKIVAPYYDVETSHSDWGNDSRESLEQYQFCSVGCLMKHMSGYFKNARGTEDYLVTRVRSAP